MDVYDVLLIEIKRLRQLNYSEEEIKKLGLEFFRKSISDMSFKQRTSFFKQFKREKILKELFG